MNLGRHPQKPSAAINFGRGFLFGIGFIIAVILGLLSVDLLYDRILYRGGDNFIPMSSAPSVPAFVASEVENHEGADGNYLLGKVTNDGTSAVMTVHIEVRFYSSGALSDECSTQLHGYFPPSESRYFKIDCREKGTHLPKHDSYELTISSEISP